MHKKNVKKILDTVVWEYQDLSTTKKKKKKLCVLLYYIRPELYEQQVGFWHGLSSGAAPQLQYGKDSRLVLFVGCLGKISISIILN